VGEPIPREILERLVDPDARFVFPSEIAASSMLAAVLTETGRRALPARRFIGWDAFKSEVFAGDARGRPSSKAIRSIFARVLAASNAAEPFLRSVVPPEAASSSARFAPSLAAALPALRAVPEGPGDHLADWREIRRRYETFMVDRGLYEAAWLGREAASPKAGWVLVYPDLTEDWDDYADAAMALPGATVVLSGSLGKEPVPAARFGTVVEEVRAVLLSIRDAVDSGADPAGIMISVASPESALPILEREAALAGVPLNVREGRPLADAMSLAGGRMSFESLRRLLLDASRPWKEKEAARRLLDIGISKHIVAPLPGDADVWEASLGSDDEARRLYRGLRTAVSRIAGAAGFRHLRSAYDAFRRAFIDEEAWSPLQNDEIARCLAVLDELEEAADAAGLAPDAFPGAAAAWLEQLEATRYLPVSESGGITVYRFPVAAGAVPDIHYVLNLAQGAAVAAARPLSFMRADERDRLGAADRDISAGLVRLLAVSGRRVFLSYSEDGPDGVRPPHPAIDARDPGSVGLAYDRRRWLPNLETDALPVTEAFPGQAASASAALATVFGSGGADWAAGTPDAPATMGPAAADAAKASMSPAGRLRLSATSIEGYSSCAFRRVFQSGLRVEPVDSGLSFIDNLLLGRIYHDAFRRLLAPLAEAGAADVAAAMGAAIRGLSGELGPMASMLVDTAAPILRRNFSRASANLLRALDGCVPVMVDDSSLTAPLDAIGAELYGRPDLVCVAPAPTAGEPRRAVIVDYKKSRIPTRAQLEPADDGSVEDIQIPAYAVLVEAAGMVPEAAYYLSIEGSEPSGKGLLEVFGPGPKPAIPAEKMPLLRPALEAQAARTAGIIGRGDVFVPAMRDRDSICSGCGLRSVCRAHYAVR